MFPLTSSRTRAKTKKRKKREKKNTHTARGFDKQFLTAERKESFGKTQRIVSASAYNSPVITVAKNKEGGHVLERVLCSTKITVERLSTGVFDSAHSLDLHARTPRETARGQITL